VGLVALDAVILRRLVVDFVAFRWGVIAVMFSVVCSGSLCGCGCAYCGRGAFVAILVGVEWVGKFV